MALPSSPPLPPQTDVLVSSPTLGPEDHGDLLPIRPSLAPIAGGSRKRQFSDYGSASSDAWFSEGTSDADEGDGVEERPRRKRAVRGPWWTVSKSLRHKMAKRERLRNADSGVWLGSDMSEDSIDSTTSSRQQLAGLDVADRAGEPSSSASLSRALSRAEALAAKEINRCLDAGQERVDLSDLGLTRVSDSTLRPLHQLIRHAHTDLTRPPSEDEFGPLTPSLQLFLSGNSLSELPRELFQLTNTSVLSVRNNELTHVPPSIEKLSNLKELNIAQNNIRWLPWEMLDLLHCRGTHRRHIIRPNPLIDPADDLDVPKPLPRPRVTPGEFKEHLSRWGETNGAFFQKMREWYSEEGVPWTIRQDLELRLKLGRLKRTNYLQEASRAGAEITICKEQLIYLSSSAVRFFDVGGSPLRHDRSSMQIDDDPESIYKAVTDPMANAPEPAEFTHVPSLFELSLRTIQATYNLSDPSTYPTDIPRSVSDAFQQAAKGVEMGNEKCSVCGKEFIIARAEWMEFWFCGFPAQEALTRESILPFLRRACGWGCVDGGVSDLGSFRL